MDKVSKKPSFLPGGLFGKRKSDTLQDKIDAAQKRQARARAEATLEPVTVSPAPSMTKAYTAVGLVFRTLTLFMGVFGLNLFLCDAAKIVILNGAKAEDITLSPWFIALWSAVVTLFVMAVSLHKISRALSPVLAVGGIAAYMFATYTDPIGYFLESFRCTRDLVFSNMASAGYTTYMQYILEEPFSYNRTELLKFFVAAVIVVSGLILGLFMAKRVRAWGVAIVCAVYMIPVFMFNITRSNKGLACVLVFICGAVALCLFDCIYGGVFAARKAKREAKKAAKAAKKAAKKAKKDARRALKNTATAAYNDTIAAGAPASAAKKARAAVYARAKKEAEEAKKTAKRLKLAEKQAKADAKKAAKEAKKAERLAKKEQKKAIRARSAALRKSKKPNAEEAAAVSALKRDAREAARAARIQRNAGETAAFKTRAASGYAGVMAMIIAFLAIWVPLTATKKNFPIIDVINNRMQLVRTYVTAYLMGDDVDLNSLAMYGGVAELNPRNVDFNTPQYTGQRLFTCEASYAAPVYMRSWIGSNYDLETDFWSSADADEVIAYRERFGSAYTPDNISYFFAKYVYPNALDVNKVDQYRNLDNFGFRVFQVHVRRRSGTSKILFVPSILNAGLGIMEFGSLDPVSKKYSAYYDGIYSSRFFDEDSTYSVSSFNPVMKHPDLAANFELSIWYYNRAKIYAETVDAIQTEIAGNLLFKEDKEYEYDTPLGTISLTGTDLSFLAEQFEAECQERGYKYKSNQTVTADEEPVLDNLVARYINMTSGERRTFMNAFDKELDYRDYAESTYRNTFGSEAIADLAQQILSDAGIVMGEKYVHDKSYLETKNENQIKRMTNLEKYGNVTGSWFTDAATGETVPRHQAIMAVLNYLRENYTYTLDPEVEQRPTFDENGDPILDEEGNPVTEDYVESPSNLEAFLFEVKQGYCVHFATSAIALLRELGFAVRYDEGYICDSWNRTYDPEAVSTYRSSVRDYDAHSWIEVYYPSMGWIMYEVTPSYMEEMYDPNVTESTTTTSGLDSSKITVRPSLDTEVMDEITLGADDEIDYTALIITGSVILGAVILLAVIWTILKIRADKASYKRQKLVEDATSEQKYQAGETDIHASARAITDAIFDVFSGLGVPPQTGELPTEYAVRISEDYADISKHKITDVMDLIEKEEFGGTLSFRELGTLAEYLKEIQGSVYAALPFLEKIRMRYFMNVV